MGINYKKLWKLLIDVDMSKVELRRITGISVDCPVGKLILRCIYPCKGLGSGYRLAYDCKFCGVMPAHILRSGSHTDHRRQNY